MAVMEFIKGPKPTVGTADPHTLYMVETDDTHMSLHMEDIAGAELSGTLEQGECVSKEMAASGEVVNLALSHNIIPVHGTGIAPSAYFYAASPAGVLNTGHDPSLGVVRYRPNLTFSVATYFEHNNGSYGGPRAALDPLAIEFVEQLGRLSLRYGMAYIISRMSMDGIVAAGRAGVDGIHRNYALRTLRTYTRTVTCSAYWIKVETGSVEVRATYINDVRRAPETTYTNVILTPADGWTHVYMAYSTPRGYNSAILCMLEVNATALFTLPYTSPSWDRIRMADHTCPQY